MLVRFGLRDITFRLIPVALLVAGWIAVANGLRCYKCPQPGKGVSFQDNMKCTEPGAGIGTPQECLNSDNTTMCLTRITEINGVQRIMRGCHRRDEVRGNDVGCWTDHGVEMCYCDTDACNGGEFRGSTGGVSQVVTPSILFFISASIINSGLISTC